MKDEYDDEGEIERMLRCLRVNPSAHVKKSVLDGFACTFLRERMREHRIGMLRRPIPLYMFLLSLIAAIGLSFIAAKQMIRPPVGLMPPQESVQEQDSTMAKGLPWAVAQRDLL